MRFDCRNCVDFEIQPLNCEGCRHQDCGNCKHPDPKKEPCLSCFCFSNWEYGIVKKGIEKFLLMLKKENWRIENE